MLHVGICLPKSCTDVDVSQLVDTMLNGRIFGEKYYLDEKFSIVESKTIKLRENFFEITMVNMFLYVIQFEYQVFSMSIRLNFYLKQLPFQVHVDIEFSFRNGWLTVHQSCCKKESYGDSEESLFRFAK